MDVIGRPYISLGSSTVKLHENLGGRRSFACLEAFFFRNQNGDSCEVCISEEKMFVA
jgi:hypothetical protein